MGAESSFREITDSMPPVPDEEVPAGAVLVVDDEESCAATVALGLGRRGVVTRVAHSADEALAILGDRDDIGVVLTDMRMPIHGGGWLIDRVRQRYPHVRIAIMSAFHKELGEYSKEARAVFHKPFDINKLMSSIIGLAVNL